MARRRCRSNSAKRIDGSYIYCLLASADAAKFARRDRSLRWTWITPDRQALWVRPVAGAYVRQALTDVDYIRRVTFNVALVSQVNSTGLTLAEPLPGGAPAAGAKCKR
jgi:hypothetical protein